MLLGALQQDDEGYVPPPPTLKSRGTSYVLVPPNFYYKIYFDMFVATYKIVPKPLHVTNIVITIDDYIEIIK